MDVLENIISNAEVTSLSPLINILSVIVNSLSLLSPTRLEYPKQATVKDGQNFDFIIVGAGSAGSVVANRLSEINNVNVLLIEAGGDPTISSEIPSLAPLLQHGRVDWDYYSVDDGYTSQAHKTNNIHITRGKMLGGCSSNNFMYYVRGNKADFDHWVELGNQGWDWETVLSYYKKSERLNVQSILNSDSAALHNTNGYMGVTQPNWEVQLKPYFEAFKENGHEILIDTNGYKQLGYSIPTSTIDNHVRQSTAAAFLSPVRERPNLHVLKDTLVTKILFDKSRTITGVEVKLNNGKIIQLKADKEVVLSAGSINSPQLLMLSGIGPKQHLEDMGIEVMLDSPNVGKNLQDHVEIFVILGGKKRKPSISDNIQILENLDKIPFPNLIGHIALNKSQTYPDYQIIGFLSPPDNILLPGICTYLNQLDDNICSTITSLNKNEEALGAFVSLLHPESRGEIKLQSRDPEDKPLIYLGYYSNDKDLERHAKYIKDYVSVVNTTFFKSIESKIFDYEVQHCKNYTFASHEYWKCFALNVAQTLYHPVGTCAMGSEGKGVVDERLRVRGVQGLRVVDGSVLPTITSGNVNAPIIMIAEKASDMIKFDHGML